MDWIFIGLLMMGMFLTVIVEIYAVISWGMFPIVTVFAAIPTILFFTGVLK